MENLSSDYVFDIGSCLGIFLFVVKLIVSVLSWVNLIECSASLVNCIVHITFQKIIFNSNQEEIRLNSLKTTNRIINEQEITKEVNKTE